MQKMHTISKPLKITRTPQISTIFFRECHPTPRGGVKRNMGHLKRPDLETPNIKAFWEKAIFSLKRGLKGVLRGLKGVVKENLNFCHFWGFSQTPFFRSEVST